MTEEEYIKVHRMTKDEDLKEYFNEVKTLTAVFRSSRSHPAEENPELEVGKKYQISHIGVFRSKTRIMLEGFGDKEYNSLCFEIFENGESIDRSYTQEKRFWAPYLRERLNRNDVNV